MASVTESAPPTPASRSADEPPLAAHFDHRPRAVTWRSLLLGLLGVAFICGLAPFNDFVLKNTYLVGNFLPIGLLLFFGAFIMILNAPLSKWAPRHAFGTGELAVALGMTLVSATLPTSGLMRYLPGFLTFPFAAAGTSVERREILQELDLPDWIFPSMQATDLRDRAIDPVIQDFVGRVPGVGDSFIDRVLAVPWAAWLEPALTWGLLIAAIFGAILCMSIIVRRQWVENERLAFPLASVYLSLIEQPKPGHAFNSLFRSKGFWFAFVAVFLLHGITALSKYDPKIWPAIPLGYNFEALFANEPWRFTEWGFKRADLYFSIIGFTYFLQTKIAFSLWFTFIAVQVVRMMVGTYQSELTGGMEQDQVFGAVVAFAIAILWIGRAQWLIVLRQMVRPPQPDEPQGRYLPYFAAGWGLVLCAGGMATWLFVAGASIPGAIVIVLGLLTLFLVISRVVAETGLIFVQIPLPLRQPWVYALQAVPESMAARTTLRSYFFANAFHNLFAHDMRETLAPYAMHSFRVADSAAYENESRWRKAIPFTIALIVALAFGYLVAGASMLYVEYNYAATLDKTQDTPINTYGVKGSIEANVLDPTRDYRGTGTGPRDSHNRWLSFGTGAGITATLSALRLRFAAWPLHPVGYLLAFSYPMRKIWFSLFVGWLAKSLLVRFGGTSVYRSSRALFVGMIIGEAGAAAFWLVVSFVRYGMGLEYEAIILMPT